MLDDLEKFRLRPGMTAPAKPRHKPSRFCKVPFLRGPIPWAWLTRAMRLPGRALAVGLVLWRQVGLDGNRTVSLSHARLQECGIDRHTARRGIRSLESAGLVAIRRRQGRCLDVTIVDIDASAIVVAPRGDRH